ncbi:MAG: cell wall hydrolase [Rhodothermales bacterium]|nr:cell wall hydrolase [Rhodothermales bacterium]
MELLTKQATGIGAVALSVLLLALSFVFNTVDRDTLAETMPAVDAAPLTQDVSVFRPAFANEDVREEVLWLARCIYSETKRPDEQELVAWVVRNRVDTAYRGVSTYRDAVLDPWQFSAFNKNDPQRKFYLGLDFDSKSRGWQTALFIAYDVMNAPAYERPFAKKTRHFYSERSMRGNGRPAWVTGRPVSLDREIDPRRFRFYANVS